MIRRRHRSDERTAHTRGRPTGSSRSRRSPDRGSGLIEILVAVVLLGLGAAGTLTALTVAIRGSGQASRLSSARRWLVSAADYVASDAVPRVPCTSGEAAVRAAYQAAAQTVTAARPAGWSATRITVVGPVMFWNGTSYTSTCYESSGLRLQLITLLATAPTGGQTETLTLVKTYA